MDTGTPRMGKVRKPGFKKGGTPWNKGLTKEDHEGIARVAKKKADWWASGDREETRRKIGEASKGRPGLKGEKNGLWKGGRYVSKRDGYIMVYVGDGKYRPEHRMVMEDELGRELTSNEEVHHINGKKDDNRLENLKVVVKEIHFCKVKCPYCGKEFEVK